MKVKVEVTYVYAKEDARKIIAAARDKYEEWGPALDEDDVEIPPKRFINDVQGAIAEGIQQSIFDDLLTCDGIIVHKPEIDDKVVRLPTTERDK